MLLVLPAVALTLGSLSPVARGSGPLQGGADDTSTCDFLDRSEVKTAVERVVASGARTVYMVMQSRVGSHMLMGLLNEHPNITFHGEACPIGRPPAEQTIAMANHLVMRDGKRVSGFRIAPSFLTMSVRCFVEMNRRLDPSGQRLFIHLRRKNRIKAVVSKIHAKHRGMVCNSTQTGWATRLSDTCDVPLPMRIAPAEFLLFLRDREKADAMDTQFVAQLLSRTLILYYEDLIADLRGQLGSVLHLLGLDMAGYGHEPLTLSRSGFVKGTNNNLQQFLANYDELKSIATSHNPMYAEQFD